MTPYDRGERYAAGDYPNQHAGGGGPAGVRSRPTARSRTPTSCVWYTFGAHHVVRPEDWPVMPVSYIGFMLKPVGFFDRNPALDVPRSPPACHTGNGQAMPTAHGDGHGERGRCPSERPGDRAAPPPSPTPGWPTDR